MKTVDEHYEDWSGQHHTRNSCRPVHDSAECCDFASYYHKYASGEERIRKNETCSAQAPEKCEEGWETGECCCNCTGLVKLFKHPWNTINKGSIMDAAGLYACVRQFDEVNRYEGVVFEFEHGFCEMYERR